MTDHVRARSRTTGAVCENFPVTAFALMPDYEPVDPDVRVPSLADGTVEHVLSQVGDDPQLAASALAAEQASPKPRTTLVERLTEIVNKES